MGMRLNARFLLSMVCVATPYVIIRVLSSSGEVQCSENPVIRTQTEMQTLKIALQTYYADMGRYPDERAGLAPLIYGPPGAANWRGP